MVRGGRPDGGGAAAIAAMRQMHAAGHAFAGGHNPGVSHGVTHGVSPQAIPAGRLSAHSLHGLGGGGGGGGCGEWN